MPPISETIQQFQRLRKHHAAQSGADRLHDLTGFAPDPGNLRARLYVPETLRPGAALVVALHGCTQDAAGYDHGTGWSTLADREGFAVLFPEQRRANNANLCFNWFEAGDIARAGGEAESIAAMIDAVLATHPVDPARVFVTGLSAGGAMAAVMLAAWPDRFAAGAIIGGLPYGGAVGVRAALERMRGQGAPDAATATAAVRAVAGPAAVMPRVAVWHGTADTTVVQANGDRLVEQWRGVHGLPAAPADRDSIGGATHSVWRDAAGRALVEEWRIAGMGHGVPVDPASGLGAAGPFMLDVGLSSTLEIARSWGLIAAAARPATPEPDAAPPRAARLERITPEPTPAPSASGVQATIEKALRAAGLLR